MSDQGGSGIRLPTWSGQSDSWDFFKFQFEAYCLQKDMITVLEGTEEDSEKNRRLYSLIVLALQNTAVAALNLVRGAERTDGRGAWKILVDSEESTSTARRVKLHDELSRCQSAQLHLDRRWWHEQPP